MHVAERKSLRHSTTQKSILAEQREKQREIRTKMMKEIAAKRNVSEVRRLTQEELLAEAKETETINLQALGKVFIIVIICQKTSFFCHVPVNFWSEGGHSSVAVFYG